MHCKTKFEIELYTNENHVITKINKMLFKFETKRKQMKEYILYDKMG